MLRAQTLSCWMLLEKNKPLEHIRKTIEQACLSADRSPNSVNLLAVSKNQPVEEITSLINNGQRWFGENRVKEAAAKWPALRALYPDICTEFRLHLIGPLQTNKVKQALTLFDVLESVDRAHLVQALTKEWNNASRLTRKILIQVNTGRESQKSGVLQENLPNLIDLCHTYDLPLTGLMCIPPAHEDPIPHFQLLAQLALSHNLTDLSMGMSADFPAAIACGATWVRVGSALWPKSTN